MKETGFKILIAEDDQDDMFLITEFIREGFGKEAKVITEATSYTEAMAQMGKEDYDLFVFDYRLGDVDGIELLRKVRERGNQKPIIFLTGQGDQQVAVEAMKAGATDYLDKAQLSKDSLYQSIRYSMETCQKEEKQKKEQESLHQIHRQMELILNSAGEGIFGLNPQGEITFVNPVACRLMGYEQGELIGKSLKEIKRSVSSDKPKIMDEGCPHYETLKDGNPHHVADDIFWRKDGVSFPVEFLSTPIIESGKIIGAVTTFRDITERKQAEKAIKNMAYYDSLTGLPNRTLLNDRLNVALTHAHRYKEMLATLFLDIDGLKPVNDSFGHAVGDLLLKALGKRLKSSLREGDTVARIGGDEFVILLTQVKQAQDSAVAAQKILDSIQTPLHLDGNDIQVTASIGIALYPQDGENRETLLEKADRALYRAKQNNKNNFQFYRSD